MLSPAIKPKLRQAALLRSRSPRITPLDVDDSCTIFLIEDLDRRFVVKCVPAKLRREGEWTADTSPNFHEQAFMRYVDSLVPGCVPKILLSNRTHSFFAMEYLGEGWMNWKTELLQSCIEGRYAVTAGETLATLHAASWESAGLRKEFASTPNFYELRIGRCLFETGRLNLAIEPLIREEVDRLANTSIALVHGNFQPKNILLEKSTSRIAMVNCKDAWFGDPVLDVAFFLSHLFLKACDLTELKIAYLSFGATFLAAYRLKLGEHWTPPFEARMTRLLLMLLLAGVDANSAAGYLAGKNKKQSLVREFVTSELSQPPATFGALTDKWNDALSA